MSKAEMTSSRSIKSLKRTHTGPIRQGKVTRNPFLNFLRDFRKSNNGLRVTELTKRGAELWRNMDDRQKSPYSHLARQVPREPRKRVPRRVPKRAPRRVPREASRRGRRRRRRRSRRRRSRRRRRSYSSEDESRSRSKRKRSRSYSKEKGSHSRSKEKGSHSRSKEKGNYKRRCYRTRSIVLYKRKKDGTRKTDLRNVLK